MGEQQAGTETGNHTGTLSKILCVAPTLREALHRHEEAEAEYFAAVLGESRAPRRRSDAAEDGFRAQTRLLAALVTHIERIEAALLLLAEGQGTGPTRAGKRILEGGE